jgi:hypothetical protein
MDYVKGTEYLNKMTASFSDLACWVTSDGKVLETGADTHASIFRAYLKSNPDVQERYSEVFSNTYQSSIYTFATRDLGWIRVLGSEIHLSVMITRNKVASKAVAALPRLIKGYDFTDYTIDYCDEDEVYKHTESEREFLAELRKNTGKELTAANSQKPTILKNPPTSKVLALIKNAHHHELKGLIVGEDVYIWNQVEDWHHGQQAIKLGLIPIPKYHDDGPHHKLKDFYKMRLSLNYEIDKDNEDRLVLFNEATQDGVDYIVKTPYLRKFIKEADIYLDDPKHSSHFIRGIDYMKEHNLESSSDYGYWLTDKGEIEKVSPEGHIDYLLKAFRDKKYTSNKFYYEHALNDLGWIRVVNETGLYHICSIELSYGSVSSGAFKALRELITKKNYYNSFVVDINRGNKPTVPLAIGRNASFKEGEESKMLHKVRECLNKEITASEDYGYFITDKGELLKVDHEDHNGVADKYIHKHMYKEYLDWVLENDEADPIEFVLYKGWIRLVTTGNSLNVEIDKSGIVKKAFTAFGAFYKKNYFDEVYVESSFQRLTTSHKKFSEYAENLDEVVGFIRTFIRKNTMEASTDTTYGYWITDKGNLLKVPTDLIGHIGILSKYRGSSDFLTHDEWNDIEDANYWPVLSKGWIRIAFERYSSMNIEIAKNCVSRDAFKKFTHLIAKEKRDEFNLDIQTDPLRERDIDYIESAKKHIITIAMEKNVSRVLMEASLSNMSLEEFIKSDLRNGYIKEEGLKSYYRKGPLSVDGKYYKKVLTRANTSNTKRLSNVTSNSKKKSTGNYRKLDQKTLLLAKEYNFDGIYVESVLNEFLGDKLLEYGYKKVNEHYGIDNYFKELMSVKEPKLEALDETPDTFEAWVTDKGVVASPISHTRTLKKILTDKKSYPKAQTEFGSNQEAYIYGTTNLGFIRVAGAVSGPAVTITENMVDPKVYKEFVRYFNARVDKNSTTMVDAFKYKDGITQGNTYKEFNNTAKLFHYIRSNVKKGPTDPNGTKTIVAIDEDNKVANQYTETTVEKWQAQGSTDQILLIQRGTDFIVRSVTKSAILDQEFKFIETAREALLNMVSSQEATGIIYKKYREMRILNASDDKEKVLKRWETKDGKNAVTLVQSDEGYSVRQYIKNMSGQFANSGSSFLGEATLDEAITEASRRANLYSTPSNPVMLIDAKRSATKIAPKIVTNKTAQITVRGNKQDKSGDFTKFSKQPSVAGLSVYVKKVGSYQYAKIVHTSSGLSLLTLSDKPLSFSPSELVERINVSPLKNFNWSLDQDSLMKKYGPSVLSKATLDFKSSLDMKKQDDTDRALTGGLSEYVKAWLIAYYFKRPVGQKNLEKQIDAQIKKNRLDKSRVYNYYGDIRIKSDKVWEKIGLVRTNDAAPYKYELASKATPNKTMDVAEIPIVDQAVKLVQGGMSVDDAVRKVITKRTDFDSVKRDVKIAIQRGSKVTAKSDNKVTVRTDTPQKKSSGATWAPYTGNYKKTKFSVSVKGVVVANVFVDDANVAKTVQSFVNDRDNPTLYASPYLKNLKYDKSKDFNIDSAYDMTCNGKLVIKFYLPDPNMVGVMNRIVAASMPPKVTKPKPVASTSGKIKVRFKDPSRR